LVGEQPVTDIRTRIAGILRNDIRGYARRLELADTLIRELDADYILVPKSHTIVRWHQEDQPPEGVFKHEVISEWTADE
jgi:hypothetical protein